MRFKNNRTRRNNIYTSVKKKKESSNNVTQSEFSKYLIRRCNNKITDEGIRLGWMRLRTAVFLTWKLTIKFHS